jgi:two-component system, NarL family, sensor histidine kinase UhpB
MRIMLVEDNPGDALIINEMLKEIYNEQYVLEHFKRVDEGLKHINEEFNIMLLDLNLPDSHGVETFNTMNSHLPELPIIILTGLVDEDLAVNIVSEGAQDYLVKGQIDKQLLSRSIKYSIERKNIEIELRKSEEKYKEMVEKIQTGLFMIDSNNQITYINNQMAGMLGYTIYYMINQDVFRFIQKKSKKVFKNHLNIDNRNVGQTYEVQFITKDRSPLWVLMSTSPLQKFNSEYIGAISIMTDINARKGMEKSIMNSMIEKDNEFSSMMGNMVEAVKPLIEDDKVKDFFKGKFT